MNNQQGVTLIELIMVVALVAVMTMLSFMQKQLELEQQQAKAVGSVLFTYNNGIRSWISENAANMPATQVREGTTWLKPHSCGGLTTRVDGYVPCNLYDATTANPIPFGQVSISTTITSVATSSGGKRIDSISTTSPFRLPSTKGDGVRADLSGIAALTAAAGGLSLDDPTPAATDGSFRSNPANGIITFKAGTNGELDAWLRTDGSNKMNNNIEFNSSSPDNMREIRNVSRLQNIAARALLIGNPGGSIATTPFEVIVDADQKVLGRLTLENKLNHATAIQITKGKINVADGDIEAKKGKVVAQAYYDADNNSYYLNPAEKSILKTLEVNDPIEITRAMVVGQSCPTTGALSRDNRGEIVSCVDGVWMLAGGARGMYGYFNSTSCPSGWVLANGSNGTVDLRGSFIRSLDMGAGKDAGRKLGSYQGDELKKHRHDFVSPSGNRYYVLNDNNTKPPAIDRAQGARLADGPNTSNDGRWWPYTSYEGTSNESRPKNVALLACMKL